MNRALRHRGFIVTLGLGLWIGAAAASAWSQSGPGQESPSAGPQAADPVVDAIGQQMSGAADETAESASGAPGAFPSFGRLVVRLVIALALTLGGLYGGLLGLRHLLGKKGSIASPHIQVVAKASLSSKASVYLVEIAGQTLVVGEGAGGVLSLLTTVTDPKTLAPKAVDRTDERALRLPKRRERVVAALTGFGEQLGITQRRLNAQSLSGKLREGTQAVRALSRRVSRRAGRPTAESIHLSQD